MKNLLSGVMLSLSMIASANASPHLEITLSNQRFTLYDGKEIIREGRVSAARPGYKTPRGIFSVQAKVPNAYSHKYHAPMPDSLFIYHSVAVHIGVVPKAAIGTSHGCIHVTSENGRYLFSVMRVGDQVIVK